MDDCNAHGGVGSQREQEKEYLRRWQGSLWKGTQDAGPRWSRPRTISLRPTIVSLCLHSSQNRGFEQDVSFVSSVRRPPDMDRATSFVWYLHYGPSRTVATAFCISGLLHRQSDSGKCEGSAYDMTEKPSRESCAGYHEGEHSSEQSSGWRLGQKCTLAPIERREERQGLEPGMGATGGTVSRQPLRPLFALHRRGPRLSIGAHAETSSGT